ncbi:hypothetical protein BSK56_27295 [Paenibacillus borealis]|uniref:Uncharacterized protein n=1 Tax=Paenibacillus borealis TaxID=160799 RepID=A0ABX3H2D1_PAEBO|nr:hypothetical protein BSK56_27295 [Paenibacillus borealis]
MLFYPPKPSLQGGPQGPRPSGHPEACLNSAAARKRVTVAADRPSFGQALRALPCEGFRHRPFAYGGCAKALPCNVWAIKPLSLRESLYGGTAQ